MLGKDTGDQLGAGACSSRSTPVGATGISGAVAVLAASHHSCALLSDNSLKCWGSNSSGRLGGGTTSSSLSPVQAPVTPGTGTHVSSRCPTARAALTSGELKCWGNDVFGLLGDGTTTNGSTPLPPQGFSGNPGVSVGITVTAITASGNVATSTTLALS